MSLDSSNTKNGLSGKVAKFGLAHAFGVVAVGALLSVGVPGVDTLYNGLKGFGAGLGGAFSGPGI